MANTEKAGNGWTSVMRWSARVIGLLASGLFLLFLVEAGPRVIPALSWSEPRGIPLLVAMVLAVVGVLIAWRWELAGGVMAVAGAAAIVGLACIGSGMELFSCAFLLTLPLLVASALFLGCCWRTRVLRTAHES
ncbi:MAG TPA: hypothetical protein VLY63_21615 [Anaerolineae bacterium]|nr:hypothetical protein [Anaerolineae bacterium]